MRRRSVSTEPRHGSISELRFLVRFVVLATLFELLFLGVLDETAWFRRYLALNVDGAVLALRSFGIAAASEGQLLAVGSTRLTIKAGCDAIEPSGLLLIALVLFPATWRARAAGAVVGLGVLQLANLVRIGVLGVALHRWPATFDTLHLAVFPALLIGLGLLVWVVWARRLREGEG